MQDVKKQSDWQIICGDCRDVLQTLPAESVQTVVTSPPYWGLRDYGLGSEQLGLEPTPELYVEHLVEIFREVRRVLRKDGTLWLNLGDCFANARPRIAFGDQSSRGPGATEGDRSIRRDWTAWNLKPKNLVGMAWRVAFALQADGWWLRSDIIWSKPNPMPESVRDRPTRSHEYVFLLTRSARYYYDAQAIAEPWKDNSEARYARARAAGHKYDGRPEGWKGDRHERWNARAKLAKEGLWHPNGRNARSVWEIPTQPYPEAHFATFPEGLARRCMLAGSRCGDTVLDPFCGSGTVGVVALRHDRSFIGIDLSEKYCAMARRRIEEDAPLFQRIEKE